MEVHVQLCLDRRASGKSQLWQIWTTLGLHSAQQVKLHVSNRSRQDASKPQGSLWTLRPLEEVCVPTFSAVHMTAEETEAHAQGRARRPPARERWFVGQLCQPWAA